MNFTCRKNELWEFNVTDNSFGIEEKYHEKIFVNFHTNRLLALKTELEKAGAEIAITHHSLEVRKGIRKEFLDKTIFNTYDDHRMVMSLSLLGLSGTPVVLDDISPVSKSFPNYFVELGKIGVEVE